MVEGACRVFLPYPWFLWDTDSKQRMLYYFITRTRSEPFDKESPGKSEMDFFPPQSGHSKEMYIHDREGTCVF